MFMSTNVITSSQKLDVANLESLSVIPTQRQVCQAIGDIVRQTEKTPNHYTYVEFPFGVLDYAGLKYIENYHTHIQLQRCKSEEKHWISGFDSVNVMKELGIRFDKIAQFFSMHVWETPSERGKTVRNIVGKRWMTDEEIDLLFNMLNATQRNDIFFVCKPSRFLYAFSKIKYRRNQDILKRCL